MIKLSSISRVALAVALLFGVNMNADAQLGKLKGLAKKAKEAVGLEGASTSASTSPSSTTFGQPVAGTPAALWQAKVEKAGGEQKLYGLDDADGQMVWKYYLLKDKPESELTKGEQCGCLVAKSLVSICYDMEHHEFVAVEGSKNVNNRTPEGFGDAFYKYIPRELKRAMTQEGDRKNTFGDYFPPEVLMPQADYDTFMRVRDRVLKTFTERFYAPPTSSY